jgi:hypothetical protein
MLVKIHVKFLTTILIMKVIIFFLIAYFGIFSTALRSLLSFILAIALLCGLLLDSGVEYLTYIIFIINIGVIAILFLFVIMFFQLKGMIVNKNISANVVLAFIFSLTFKYSLRSFDLVTMDHATTKTQLKFMLNYTTLDINAYILLFKSFGMLLILTGAVLFIALIGVNLVLNQYTRK